jgi:hypothetical protein
VPEPTDPIVALVAALGDDVPARDDLARARARARLERALAREAARRPHPRPRRRAAGLAAAAVLAVALVAAQALVPAGPGARSAAAALLAVAATAEGRPGAPLGPGAYAYELARLVEAHSYRTIEGDGFEVLVTREVETWAAADGSGRIRAEPGAVRFASPEDEARWRAAGAPALPATEPRDERYGPGELAAVAPDALPSDPAALLALLERRTVLDAPPGDLQTLDLIADLLRPATAPPEQRAALFRAAALLPGITVDGEVLDPAGRPGVGFSLVKGDRRLQLVFDPTTTELLGERTLRAGPQGTWRLVQEAAYLAFAVVEEIDERPSA